MANNLAASSTVVSSQPIPNNPHTAFVENVFASGGMFLGVMASMFNAYSRVHARADDFEVQFMFVKDTWQIRFIPKTPVGKFAISQLKEATIKAELSGKEGV